MLRIAKVLKSNGVDGDVLVSAPEFALEDLTGPVFVDFDGLPAPFFIESCTPKGTGKYIVHLTDVSNLKDAEEMVGRDLCTEEEFEEEEPEQDFTGWTVLDKGRKIGTVSDCEPIPGNLCLYVTAESGEELMVPLHEDLILGADPRAQVLNLDVPEGLI